MRAKHQFGILNICVRCLSATWRTACNTFKAAANSDSNKQKLLLSRLAHFKAHYTTPQQEGWKLSAEARLCAAQDTA